MGLISAENADAACAVDLRTEFRRSCSRCGLAPGQPSKDVVFFFGIKEFGPSVLQHLGAWIPVAILRTDVSKVVGGGLSNCVGKLLRRLGEQLDGGFVTQSDGGPIHIFLKFGCILADGAGIQYFWNSKGANALMPCWDCLNISNLEGDDGDTLITHDASGRLRDIKCNNANDFVEATFETRLYRFLFGTSLTRLGVAACETGAEHKPGACKPTFWRTYKAARLQMI